jgi:hypothetical protein
MLVQRILGFAGVIAMGVGLVGLFAPVSVSPNVLVVDCGSAVSPDLSAARANDDESSVNTPTPGGVLVDTSYTDLCRMDLEDRRVWTISLAAIGALGIAAAAAHRVVTRRGRRRSHRPNDAP